MKHHGGYLFHLLIYDVFCFIVCFTLLLVTVHTGNSKTLETGKADFTAKTALFNAQLIYGYLSMPFALFTIPILSAVLTHSIPTAYDRLGRCRPLERPKPKEPPAKAVSEEGTESETPRNTLIG